MRVPRPVYGVALTTAFPLLTSVAWFLKYASLGEVFIAMQLSLLTFQIQKYFWSEADYHEVKRFLFGRNR